MALPGWRHRLQQALEFDHRVGGLRERRRRKLAAGHHLHPHTSPLHGLDQRHEVGVGREQTQRIQVRRKFQRVHRHVHTQAGPPHTVRSQTQ